MDNRRVPKVGAAERRSDRKGASRALAFEVATVALVVAVSAVNADGEGFSYSFELRKGVELPDTLPDGLRGWQGISISSYARMTGSSGQTSTASIGGALSGEFAGRRATGSLQGQLVLSAQGGKWVVREGRVSGTFQLELPTPLAAEVDVPVVGKVKVSTYLVLGGGFEAELGPGGSLVGGALSFTVGGRVEARANVNVFILSVEFLVSGQFTATLSGGYETASHEWWLELEIKGELGARARIGDWAASFSVGLSGRVGTRGSDQAGLTGQWSQSSPWEPVEYVPTNGPHQAAITVVEANDDAEFSPTVASLGDGSPLVVWSRRSSSAASGVNLYAFAMGESDQAGLRQVTNAAGDELSPSLAAGPSREPLVAYLNQPILEDSDTLGDVLPARTMHLAAYHDGIWTERDLSSIPAAAYGRVRLATGRGGGALMVLDVDEDARTATTADSKVAYVFLEDGAGGGLRVLEDDAASYDPVSAALEGGDFLLLLVRDEDGQPATLLDRDLYWSVVRHGVASSPVPLLEDSVEQGEPFLVSTPSGGAALVFVETDGGGDAGVVRFAEFDGRKWGRPQTLSSGEFHPRSPSLAFAPDGSVLASWTEDGRPQGGPVVAYRPVGSRAWFPPVFVEDSGFESSSARAVPRRDGFEAVWVSSAPSFGGELSEGDLVRTPLGTAQLESTPGTEPPRPPAGASVTVWNESPPAWFAPVVGIWVSLLIVGTAEVIGLHSGRRKQHE